MIGMKVTTSFNVVKLINQSNKGIANSLKHAAAIVRKDMKASLGVVGMGKPSAPGRPPHRQSGKLQRSILYGLDNYNDVVVGSMPRSLGWYGKLHEHGGRSASVKHVTKDFQVGDEGPVRVQARSKRKSDVVYVPLKSQKQVDMANRINKRLAKSKQKHLRRHAKTDAKKVYTDFPTRPFARPALIRNLSRIPYSFRDALTA